MKTSFSVIFLFLSIAFLLSCQKELSYTSDENTQSTDTLTNNNHPIQVDVGFDKIVYLPNDSITLKGFAEYNDGSIISFQWSKISGPGTPTITNPDEAETQILNLTKGEYFFELKVKGEKNAEGRDTLKISVIEERAISFGTIKMLQTLFGVVGSINDISHYDSLGQIIRLTSNQYPERIITYENGLIATIEYWFGRRGESSFYKDYTHFFFYDEKENVIKIEQKHRNDETAKDHIEFQYNPDNTLKRKKIHRGIYDTEAEYEYVYTDGNLTQVIEGNYTYTITYDNRENNFGKVYKQNYFLDTQTIFEATNRSEMFYFSKNYPTSIGSLPIQVSVNANLLPFEIFFDGQLWYRYSYD